jgi:MFS family permease
MTSRGARLLAVLLAGQAVANIDTAIVNVATPSIHADLSASGAQLQLVVSGYILAYAVLLITGARLGHLWGYRRMFVLGLAIFTLASLGCGIAAEPTSLIVARSIQGAGAALLVPQVLSAIQINFSGDARTRALGLFVVVLSASAVLGQVAAGLLLALIPFASGWRALFLVNVPIGGLLVPAAMRWLPPDASRRRTRLDLPGVGWLSLALVLLLVPLSIGREAGWPLWTWVCLAASAPTLALFGLAERRVAELGGSPLVDLRLLARPEVGCALASRAAAAATYFALLFIIALYLQQGLGKSPLYSGLALVAWVAAFGVGGPVLRRLPGWLAERAAAVGCLGMAATYAGLGLGVGSTPLLVGLLTVGGLGFGFATTALLMHLTSVVPGEAAADVSGLYNTNSQLAAVAGLACFGTLYLSLAESPARAFAVVCLAFAVTAVLAAVAADRARRASARAAISGSAGPQPCRARARSRAPSGGPMVAASGQNSAT